MQLDQLPFLIVERTGFLQDCVWNAHFSEVVQRSSVKNKVGSGRAPPEMFREHRAVVAKSDVVVCGLVIFIADGLVQALRGVEVSLRELTGFFLLALEGLLKLGRVEQQLAMRRCELLGTLALGIEELAEVLRVKIKLRLASRKRVAAWARHSRYSARLHYCCTRKRHWRRSRARCQPVARG